MNVVNLTPHEIVVAVDENHTYRFPPSGTVARVTSNPIEVGKVVIGKIGDIPVVKAVYGDVENMPEPEEGTIYIVSSLVAQALAGKRDDVVAPDTGPTAVRNEQGQIIAVRRFQRW